MSRIHPSLGAAAAALALVLAPGALSADGFQSFAGTTRGRPTWNRPIGGGPGISGSSPRYDVQAFFLENASNCYIYSAQDYDGYIHLYQNSFNPTDQLTNLLAGDDDGDLGIGTSQIGSIALGSGQYFLVSSGFSSSSQGSFQNTIHCNNSQPIQGSCFFTATPRDRQTCQFDRFAVRITGISNSTDGIGTPVPFGSTDSSIFWFFSDTNYEAVVKVLNACAINDRFWVFIGALTDQAYTVQVGDALTQQINSYVNVLGNRSPAFTDTNAFDCTP